MWVLVLLVVVAVTLFAVEAGYMPPLTTNTLIQVSNGAVRVAKGQLSARTMQHVTEILRESGVREGYIAVTSARRVAFSRMIPPQIHQQLRNVLLNPLR
jgi:hypothetical protein